MQDYKKLDVWQKSYRLALQIYRLSAEFPKDELYRLVSQMRRSAVSVPANIAEGCGRYTTADFLRFLDIAMGSLSETDCYLMFSRDLSYIEAQRYTAAEQDLNEVRRMLIALIQKIRRSSTS